MVTHSYIYNNGKTTFKLDDSSAATDNVNVNVNPNAVGSFTFSGTNQADPPAALGNLNIEGPSTGTAKVDIDPGKTVYNNIYISALANGSTLSVNDTNFTTGTLILNGTSPENRFTFFNNAINSTGVVQGKDTLFVLNANEKGAKTSNIVDAGGNLVFANGEGGELFQNQPAADVLYRDASDYVTNYSVLGYNGKSILAAGQARNTFNIHNNDPNLTGVGAGEQIPSTASTHLDLVLDTYTPISTKDNVVYIVDQDATAATNLFQRTGDLYFNGLNTALVLNNTDTNVTLGSTSEYADLRGDDQAWIGDGNAYITAEAGNNAVYTTGRGNIIINNQSGIPNEDTNIPTQEDSSKAITQAATGSTSSNQDATATPTDPTPAAPSPTPRAPGVTGNLTVYGFGNQAGNLIYLQGAEQANIGGQNNHLIAVLGTGTSTFDLSGYAFGAASQFGIYLNSGNVIFNNFTNSAALNMGSHNNIYLGQNEEISSIDYKNNNTIYTMSNGSVVTFTGVDLTATGSGGNNNPFTAYEAAPSPILLTSVFMT